MATKTRLVCSSFCSAVITLPCRNVVNEAGRSGAMRDRPGARGVATLSAAGTGTPLSCICRCIANSLAWMSGSWACCRACDTTSTTRTQTQQASHMHA